METNSLQGLLTSLINVDQDCIRNAIGVWCIPALMFPAYVIVFVLFFEMCSPLAAFPLLTESIGTSGSGTNMFFP